ncbi:MAG: hypothetical protein ACYC3A_08325 [Halothiobacillus sp.]
MSYRIRTLCPPHRAVNGGVGGIEMAGLAYRSGKMSSSTFSDQPEPGRNDTFYGTTVGALTQASGDDVVFLGNDSLGMDYGVIGVNAAGGDDWIWGDLNTLHDGNWFDWSVTETVDVNASGDKEYHYERSSQLATESDTGVGDDVIYAGAGDDVVFGERGNDSLNGDNDGGNIVINGLACASSNYGYAERMAALNPNKPSFF